MFYDQRARQIYRGPLCSSTVSAGTASLQFQEHTRCKDLVLLGVAGPLKTPRRPSKAFLQAHADYGDRAASPAILRGGGGLHAPEPLRAWIEDRSTCIPELRRMRALVSCVVRYLRLSRHSVRIFRRKQNAVVALFPSSGIGGMPKGRFHGVNDLASAGKWKRGDVLSAKKTSAVRPVHSPDPRVLWIYASREVLMPTPRLLRLASSPMPVRTSSRSHVYLSPTRTNLVEYRKNKALSGDNGSEEHCRFRNAPHCVLLF
ncbi:hypothetical protein KC319_g1 [Hortaea werneckii]|nr:hypothetical protein KC319_g1 [Hortaea werneckii]